jgi:hypothetical protein
VTSRRAGLFVAFCILVVIGRVVGSGTSELRAAARYEAAGQHHEAAISYGNAIRMYLPASPIGARASERLLALAERASSAQQPDESRFCLEELRSGWLAVRSLWQPGASWIAEAEQRLVPLMTGDGRSAWPDPALSAVEREAVVRDVLASRDDPRLTWVVLMGVGYLLWLGGACLAIWRGIPAAEAAPVRWKTVFSFAGLSACGYVLWLLALARA